MSQNSTFENLIPEFITQEDQDALSFKITDKSTWGSGDQDAVTAADLHLSYYNNDKQLVTFDSYPLVIDNDRDRFLEYLGNAGHRVFLSSFKISGVPVSLTRFQDGYYILRLVFNNGDYALGTEPNFIDNQGFLAFARAKTRRTPLLLSWPMSDEVRRKSTDIQMLRMYLDAAEEAVDLGKYNEFLSIMAILNSVFDYYKINIPY
jgi:hypothetical protein